MSAPYDTAETVLQAARIYINDAGNPGGLSGNILSDAQPYTLPLLNFQYRKLQDKLIDAGVETFSKYGEIDNITPAVLPSIRVQVWVNYNGYFDGQAFHEPTDTAWAANTVTAAGTIVLDSNGNLEMAMQAGTTGAVQPTWPEPPEYYAATSDGTSPNNVVWALIYPNTLPPDLLKPLELWESQSLAIGGAQIWYPMRQASDSISTRATSFRFRIWDFQNDQLFLPGASQQNDLKLKYICYAPDLETTSSPVMVSRCQEALSKMVALELAQSRGANPQVITVFETAVQKAINSIINRSARKEQYARFVRVPFRSRGRGRR